MPADMLTRAELEYRSRACLAQLKLRVVVFSMAVGLPPWLGGYALRKLGFNLPSGMLARAAGLLLLLIYLLGVFKIYQRTQRDCGLACPKCRRLLGPELGRLSPAGECRHCREKISE